MSAQNEGLICGDEGSWRGRQRAGESATRGGTARGAWAGGDDTGWTVASGVAGDPATDWSQAAAWAATAVSTAAGTTAAGATAGGAAAAGNAAAGPAAAGATAARATAGGAAAAGDAAGGAAAGLLAEANATALVKARGTTTGADHGVREWRIGRLPEE